MIRRPPRSTPLSLHDALPISLNVSPLNVAAPVVPVVAVLLLAVAPAGLGVAVTTTLLWLTGLPLASCSCTTRSEEHTSELQSQSNLVCRLLLEKKNNTRTLYADAA